NSGAWAGHPRPRQPLSMVRSVRCASRLAPGLGTAGALAPTRTASRFSPAQLPSPVARSPSTPPGLEVSTTGARNTPVHPSPFRLLLPFFHVKPSGGESRHHRVEDLERVVHVGIRVGERDIDLVHRLHEPVPQALLVKASDAGAVGGERRAVIG